MKESTTTVAGEPVEPTSVRFQVIRVTRSPMNPKQFLCDLACGCEQWVTRSKRPRMGETRLACKVGHVGQVDPLPDGFAILDVTETTK